MSFLIATKAQARAIRRALRQQDGLPARGVTVGPVKWEPPTEIELDENGDPKPTPGWTSEAIGEGDEAGAQVALEIPDRLEAKLTAPQRAALVTEDALPAALRDARRAKRDVSAMDGAADLPKRTVPRP